MLMTQMPGFFSKEDSLSFGLPQLFEGWGYKKYSMSKFEEYSFYSDNRSFLTDDGIIAFNNADGRLMALKPDITLSIVKNAKLSEKLTKLYYNESVFRMAAGTRDFREIKQCGVEVLGEIDDYLTSEIIMLAAYSLAMIDRNYVLSVSHNALLLSLIESCDIPQNARKQIIACISSRNIHDFRRTCVQYDIPQDITDKMAALAGINGKIADALPLIKALATTEKMNAACLELEYLCRAMTECEIADRIHIDLSVTQHIDYYTGIVFRGYVEKAPVAVLSGGRYDKLAKKIRDDIGAVGFAVYLDNLNLYYRKHRDLDADVLVICKEGESALGLLELLNEYTNSGLSVRVEREQPESFRALKTMIYSNGVLEEVPSC